eukprot:CAMPEP_0114672754 /NCGR_PEP_ID=MMETSP0191-20121206/43444_1 /TAXON_ID=126664 /ORGANISM="Sorites sp." /LENGTH=61 /DNA_ID=CAMNT_0001935853 /DNA_START=762 /DNA_END=947 /DNA_ORIENTATION=+
MTIAITEIHENCAIPPNVVKCPWISHGRVPVLRDPHILENDLTNDDIPAHITNEYANVRKS